MRSELIFDERRTVSADFRSRYQWWALYQGKPASLRYRFDSRGYLLSGASQDGEAERARDRPSTLRSQSGRAGHQYHFSLNNFSL